MNLLFEQSSIDEIFSQPFSKEVEQELFDLLRCLFTFQHGYILAELDDTAAKNTINYVVKKMYEAKFPLKFVDRMVRQSSYLVYPY